MNLRENSQPDKEHLQKPTANIVPNGEISSIIWSHHFCFREDEADIQRHGLEHPNVHS